MAQTHFSTNGKHGAEGGNVACRQRRAIASSPRPEDVECAKCLAIIERRQRRADFAPLSDATLPQVRFASLSQVKP